MSGHGYRTAAFYLFVELPDCAALQAPLLARCEALQIKGLILLAHEGINGTVAGAPDNIAALKRSTTSDERLQRYGFQHQAFGEKIAKLRKKSLPALQKLTRAIVDRILQIGAEAEAEEVALYSTRGLPSPAHSAIKDHFVRAAQELRDNLHFQERAGMGLRFEKFLNLFEIKKT
jgi:predicted sulfurtransferase